MFVWPHKLILKTCGTTTLLLGLQALLDIASKHCGLNEMYRCFYSRKAFMFPERQIGPHKNWDDEVKFLDDLFGECGQRRQQLGLCDSFKEADYLRDIHMTR